MDDNAIVDTLVRDEELGYAMLLERYAAYVAAIIGGMAKGALPCADQEELAADVFFRVWRKREQLKSASLKAYIAQTARNATIDRLRGAGAVLVPYEDDVLALSREPWPDELVIAREQKQVVSQLVDALGEPEREIFIRYYYFGEKVRLIADRLQLNISTVKTKLSRTRAVLGNLLQERGYGCE